MKRSNPSPRRVSERVWLHRSQWRTVAALLLLLAAVVVSLALVAGFWWTLRPRQTVAARPPAEPRATPVATVTISARSLSVVEVYPATLIQPRGPTVTLPSPGGKVAMVAVRVGQRVRAGQTLVHLEQPQPAPAPVAPRVASARTTPLGRAHRGDPGEAARLRRRLEALRSQIEQARLAAAAAARPAGDTSRVRATPPVAETQVERARQALAAATERRLRTDARYQSHLATRFQYHLARSGELVAQVELRQAEERASAATPAREAIPAPANAGATVRAEERVARLEGEARDVANRLARVSEQVAAAREQLPPPPPAPKPTPAVRSHTVAARAPRAGIVATVWASTGETIPRGKPLLVIARPTRPFLVARVRRDARASFTPGSRVTIRQRDGRTLVARVTRARREPDGTGLVEVVLPPQLRLESGAVLVPPHGRPAAPLLPAAALERERNETSVWVAVPRSGAAGGWIARRQVVGAARAGRNRVALISGVHPGDRVIVAGSQALRDGQPVAPVEVGSLQAGE